MLNTGENSDPSSDGLLGMGMSMKSSILLCFRALFGGVVFARRAGVDARPAGVPGEDVATDRRGRFSALFCGSPSLGADVGVLQMKLVICAIIPTGDSGSLACSSS